MEVHKSPIAMTKNLISLAFWRVEQESLPLRQFFSIGYCPLLTQNRRLNSRAGISLSSRQHDSGANAASWSVAENELAPVGLHDRLGDRQAEADSAGLPAS